MDVRARVLETPLQVAFREIRTASGQVCIALDSDSDSEREIALQVDYEDDDEQDEDDAEELQGFDASPWPTQPTVLTIDSDDDEEEEQQHEIMMPDSKPMKSDPEHQLISPERTQPSDRPSRATPLPSLVEVQELAPVREDGSRRMDETDAAFLLFYGVRETPSANTLRLIIGTGVGSSNSFVNHSIEHALWGRLNARIDAGLASERKAQSEWMRIVFGEQKEPSIYSRLRRPMERAPLLPRPLGITLRPLEQIKPVVTPHHSHKKRPAPSASATCNDVNAVKIESECEKKRAHKGGKSNGKRRQGAPPAPPPRKPMPDSRHQWGADEVASQQKPSSGAAAPSIASKGTSWQKSPETPLSRAYGGSPMPCSSPRKPRRRSASQCVSSSPGLPPQMARDMLATMPTSHTLGFNRSMPVGWTSSRQELALVRPIPVNPMYNMSVDELRGHIKSVRRDGYVKGFESLSEVLDRIMTDPRNRRGTFNSPVDPIALDLPTYRVVIEHPMDLGTIKTKLSQGRYMDTTEFVADVRLVFENAMRFNPPMHYVHIDAQVLLKRFEDAMNGDGSKRSTHKRKQAAARHACSVCRGQTCSLCDLQCLVMAHPYLQCGDGDCGAEIRKGMTFFTTRDGTRVWCLKCRNRLLRISTGASKKGGRPTKRVVPLKEVEGEVNPEMLHMLEGLIEQKCENGVEPWVQCSRCDQWLHQVCGLYNPVYGAYRIENDYVCPFCYCREKASTAALASGPFRNLLNPAMSPPQKKAQPPQSEPSSSCLNIPSCELSEFVQAFLERELTAMGETTAAQSLHVRVLSFPNQRFTVPEEIVTTFGENASLLSQVCPGIDSERQRMPAEIDYLSRGLYLFQRHDGVDVCLFTLYTQEYGDSCALSTNRRSVYISYLDSVRYLTPATARTAAYHIILLAYFDYVRRHGFERVYIWSCPPAKRISYVFWCRPPFQKTPSAEHLRTWYKKLLTRGKDRGIVREWSTMLEQFFTQTLNPAELVASHSPQGDCGSIDCSSNSRVNGIGTRGVMARSIDASELVWPAQRVPPLFEGDCIPDVLRRVYKRIDAHNGKVRRASVMGGKNALIGTTGGKKDPEAVDSHIKQEAGTGLIDLTSSSSTTPLKPVDIKLADVFIKAKFQLQSLKNDLLVVDLVTVDSDSDSSSSLIRSPCCPEQLVASWSPTVPQFFGSRSMFHQLCSYAGYQFDSLRRAKHSTMMMLHHFFNEAVPQVNVFCRDCHLLITHADFWSCPECDRVALCDSCFQTQKAAGCTSHHGQEQQQQHALVFGKRQLGLARTNAQLGGTGLVPP